MLRTDAPQLSRVELKRALDTGDLGSVVDTLRAMAVPPAADVDMLLQRLDDPAQREAVEAIERARWAGGDGVQARAAARSAFASGPRWRSADVARTEEPLPPLYPTQSRPRS